MGQIEVYEFLKRQRQQGDDRYYSIRDCVRMMNRMGYSESFESVRKAFLMLEKYGYCDYKLPSFNGWNTRFRLKDKYLEVKTN